MLRSIINYMSVFMRDNEGQGMVEYVLLVGLISVAVIAVLLLLGPAISAEFQTIIDNL